MKVYTVRQSTTCKRTNYVVTNDVKFACSHIIESTMKQYKDIPFLTPLDTNDELTFISEYIVNEGEHITAFERLKYKEHMKFEWTLDRLSLQRTLFSENDLYFKTYEVNAWNFGIAWILVQSMYNIQSRCLKYNCKEYRVDFKRIRNNI